MIWLGNYFKRDLRAAGLEILGAPNGLGRSSPALPAREEVALLVMHRRDESLFCFRSAIRRAGGPWIKSIPGMLHTRISPQPPIDCPELASLLKQLTRRKSETAISLDPWGMCRSELQFMGSGGQTILSKMVDAKCMDALPIWNIRIEDLILAQVDLARLDRVASSGKLKPV